MRSGMASREVLAAPPCWAGAKAAADPARREAMASFMVVGGGQGAILVASGVER